jgi:hypothetical protein
MADFDFGTLSGPDAIDDAVRERLRDWMGAALWKLERQQSLPCATFDRLRGFAAVAELARWPEDQLPCAVVITPGTTDTVKDGAGTYSAVYTVGIAIMAGAATELDTRRLAMIYGKAVRGAMLFRRKLAPGITALEWTGESFDEFDVDERRSLFGSVNTFAVELRDIATWKEGPRGDPPEADPCPQPTMWVAEEVNVEVTEKPEEDS